MSVLARRLSTGAVAVLTNAAPNTTTTHTILAAPGAGFRYRLYDVSVRKTDLGAVFLPAIGRLNWVDASASNEFNATKVGDTNFLSDVGYPLAENTAITAQSQSTVANTPLEISAIYSIEKV